MRGEQFSTIEEVKRELGTGRGAGTVVGNNRGEVLFHRGEGHAMVEGESGAGKSRGAIYATAADAIQKGETLVALDPKGEIYRHVQYMISRKTNVLVFDLRTICRKGAACFNPLAEPYRRYKNNTREDIFVAELMVKDLATILYPLPKDKDTFWTNSAKNLFVACVYALFELARDNLIPEDQVNMVSVFYLIELGEQRNCGTIYLKDFVDMFSKRESMMGLKSYLSCTASDTRAGIRSTFMEQMNITSSQSIRDFLSHDDLKISELKGDRQTLIFIILPDETPVLNFLGNMLLSQLMTHYIRMAETDYGGKLPIRTNFVIEEMAAIGGAIPNFEHFLSASRSRNIKCVFCLQNAVQLEDLYGKTGSRSILSNTRVRISFRVNDIGTLKELSELVGDKETLRKGYFVSEPLITPSQLHALEDRQALVMIGGRIKYITRFPDFSMLKLSRYTAKDKYILEDHEQIRKNTYFNIIEFMKQQKADPKNLPFRPSRWSNMPIPTILEESEEDPSVSSDKNEKPAKDLDVNEMIRRIDARIAELEREEQEAETKAAEEKAAKESAEKAAREAAKTAEQTAIKRHRTRKNVSIMHPGDSISSFREILADYVDPDVLENAVRSCIFDTYTIRGLTQARVDKLMARLEKIHCLAVVHESEEPY